MEMDEDEESANVNHGRITNKATKGSSGEKPRYIRPVERQRMRPWLEEHLDENDVPGLVWQNRREKIFRIAWKHAANQCFNMQKDTNLFERWAVHTGRHQDSDHKRWKANFRCALNSLPDVQENKEQGIKKGNNAFKVYRFLDEKETKFKDTHRTTSVKRRKDMDLVAQVPVTFVHQARGSTGPVWIPKEEGESADHSYADYIKDGVYYIQDGASTSGTPGLPKLEDLCEAAEGDSQEGEVIPLGQGDIDSNLQEILAAATASLAAGNDAISLEQISIDQLSQLGEKSKMKLELRTGVDGNFPAIRHVFLCGWCEKVFPSKVELFQHFLIFHQDKLIAGETYGAAEGPNPSDPKYQQLQQEIEHLEKEVLNFTRQSSSSAPITDSEDNSQQASESSDVIEDGQVVDMSTDSKMTSQDMYVEEEALDLSVKPPVRRQSSVKQEVALDLSVSTKKQLLQKLKSAKGGKRSRKGSLDIDYTVKFGNYGISGKPRTKRQLDLHLRKKEEEEEKLQKQIAEEKEAADNQHSMEDLVHAEILMSLQTGANEEVEVKPDVIEVPMIVKGERGLEETTGKKTGHWKKKKGVCKGKKDVQELNLDQVIDEVAKKGDNVEKVKTEKPEKVKKPRSYTLKAFKCGICMKKFEDSSALYAHVLEHRGQEDSHVALKQPSPPIININKEIDKSGLESVIVTTKTDQPQESSNIQCDICKISFETNKELDDHFAEHFNLVCKFCDVKIGSMDLLQEHKKEHVDIELISKDETDQAIDELSTRTCSEIADNATNEDNQMDSADENKHTKGTEGNAQIEATEESKEIDGTEAANLEEVVEENMETDTSNDIIIDKVSMTNTGVQETTEPETDTATNGNRTDIAETLLDNQENNATHVLIEEDTSKIELSVSNSVMQSIESEQMQIDDSHNMMDCSEVNIPTTTTDNVSVETELESMVEDSTKEENIKGTSNTTEDENKSTTDNKLKLTIDDIIEKKLKSIMDEKETEIPEKEIDPNTTEKGDAKQKEEQAEITKEEEELEIPKSKGHIVQCGICNKKMYFADVSSHLEEHDTQSKVTSKRVPKSLCMVCSYHIPLKEFDKHMKTHRPYELSNVQKLLTHYQDLQNKYAENKLTVKKEDKIFLCNLCNQGYDSCANLAEHVEQHLTHRNVSNEDMKIIGRGRKRKYQNVYLSLDNDEVKKLKAIDQGLGSPAADRNDKGEKKSPMVIYKEDLKQNKKNSVLAAALSTSPKYGSKLPGNFVVHKKDPSEETSESESDKTPSTSLRVASSTVQPIVISMPVKKDSGQIVNNSTLKEVKEIQYENIKAAEPAHTITSATSTTTSSASSFPGSMLLLGQENPALNYLQAQNLINMNPEINSVLQSGQVVKIMMPVKAVGTTPTVSTGVATVTNADGKTILDTQVKLDTPLSVESVVPRSSSQTVSSDNISVFLHKNAVKPVQLVANIHQNVESSDMEETNSQINLQSRKTPLILGKKPPVKKVGSKKLEQTVEVEKKKPEIVASTSSTPSAQYVVLNQSNPNLTMLPGVDFHLAKQAQFMTTGSQVPVVGKQTLVHPQQLNTNPKLMAGQGQLLVIPQARSRAQPVQIQGQLNLGQIASVVTSANDAPPKEHNQGQFVMIGTSQGQVIPSQLVGLSQGQIINVGANQGQLCWSNQILSNLTNLTKVLGVQPDSVSKQESNAAASIGQAVVTNLTSIPAPKVQNVMPTSTSQCSFTQEAVPIPVLATPTDKTHTPTGNKSQPQPTHLKPNMMNLMLSRLMQPWVAVSSAKNIPCSTTGPLMMSPMRPVLMAPVTPTTIPLVKQTTTNMAPTVSSATQKPTFNLVFAPPTASTSSPQTFNTPSQAAVTISTPRSIPQMSSAGINIPGVLPSGQSPSLRLVCNSCNQELSSLESIGNHICKQLNQQKSAPSTLTQGSKKRLPTKGSLDEMCSKIYVKEIIEMELDCQGCSLVFKDEKERFEHVSKIHPEKMQRCEFCMLLFVQEIELKVHEVLAHPMNCKECSFRCSLENDMMCHIMEQHAIRPVGVADKFDVQCHHCHVCFASTQKCLAHMRLLHPEEALTIHMKIPFDTKNKKNWCDVCQCDFVTSDMRTSHLERSHFKTDKYRCGCCMPKIFNLEEQSIQEHLRSHISCENDSPLHIKICEICQLFYPNQAFYDRHIQGKEHILKAEISQPIGNKYITTKLKSRLLQNKAKSTTDYPKPPDANSSKVLSPPRVRKLSGNLAKPAILRTSKLIKKVKLTQQKMVKPEETGSKQVFKCDQCVQGPFKTGYLLKQHKVMRHMLPQSRSTTSYYHHIVDNLKRARKFQCMICDQKFDLQTTLLRHLRSCNKKVSGKNFKHKVTKQGHTQEYLNENNEVKYVELQMETVESQGQATTDAFTDINTADDISLSNVENRNQTIFTCKLCKLSLSDMNNLKLHIFETHSSKFTECLKCKKVFLSRIDFDNHDIACKASVSSKQTLSPKKNQKKRLYGCGLCQKSFYKLMKLTKHIWEHDQLGKNKEETKCKTSTSTDEGQSSILMDVIGNELKTKQQAMSVNETEARYMCSICKTKFTESADLFQHSKSHFEVSELVAICRNKMKRAQSVTGDPCQLPSELNVAAEVNKGEETLLSCDCNICGQVIHYEKDKLCESVVNHVCGMSLQ